MPARTCRTRPFLQTGSYGSNIGQVVLTYNTITDAVTGYTVAEPRGATRPGASRPS